MIRGISLGVPAGAHWRPDERAGPMRASNSETASNPPHASKIQPQSSTKTKNEALIAGMVVLVVPATKMVQASTSNLLLPPTRLGRGGGG